MATKKEIELCQEILGVAIQLTAAGKYNAFVDFSGHVNQIEVRIKSAPRVVNQDDIEGWSCHDNYVYLSTGYKLDDGEDMDAVVAYKVDRLQEIKSGLLNPLEGEVSK